jgi:hypothetical protein
MESASEPSLMLVAALPRAEPRVRLPIRGVTLSGWDTFEVVVGGAAGALIGLLFISVSIRIEVISASPDFRNRAAATLSLLIAVLLVAIVLAIPGQHQWELGAELLVLALALSGGLFWLDRRASASPRTQPISRVLGVLSPDTITSLFLAASGALLLAGVTASTS